MNISRSSLSPDESLNTLCTAKRSPNVAQHERIRLDIQSRLLSIVKSKFPDTPNKKHSTVAKALDQLLFRSAASLEDYSDLSTLDTRIRAVVTEKLQQQQRTIITSCKKQSQQAMKKTTRKQVLKDILKDDYDTAAELVREIKLAKNRKVASFKCFGGVCVRQSPSFSENFPSEIKELFFGTALVDAFDRIPIQKLASTNWKHLIQVAQTNLDAYQASPHCVQGYY